MTGELATATSDVQDINAGTTTASANAISAIIIPQTVTGGTQFVKVQHSSKTYFYTLSANKSYEAGRAYNYNLKVKENLTELTLMSNSVTDWKNEEVIEGEIIETSTPTIKNITANTATLTAFAVGGRKGIEISASPQFTNSITAGETTSSDITAEFTSLLENTKYYARTYTIDAANRKSYSEAIMFVPTSVYPKPLILVSDNGKTAEVIENGIPVTSKGYYLINCSHLCYHENHGLEYIITNGVKKERKTDSLIMTKTWENFHTDFFCWYAINKNGTTYSDVFSFWGGCECDDEPYDGPPLDEDIFGEEEF
jgi:hypothetical protein